MLRRSPQVSGLHKRGPRFSRFFAGMRVAIAAIALAALVAASHWSLRVGYADSLFARWDPQDISGARRLAPTNAKYWTRMRGEGTEPLTRALALNPYNSEAWIELGLERELGGDPKEAERLLLEAVRVDRTFVPLWTLANFYFRQQRREEFWVWARRAAAIAPHDQSALFDLCWRMSQDDREILEKAIPRSRVILAQYLYYLLRTGRLQAATKAAEMLTEAGQPPDKAAVLACCDRLLESGRVLDAEGLWKRLCRAKWVPYPANAAEGGQWLNNGEFRIAPLNAGFDWRIVRNAGVEVIIPKSSTGVSVEFSGRQAENCLLLEQVVPVRGGRRYRLGYSYRTEGIPPGSGLRWVAGALGGEGGWLAESEHLSSEDWAEGALRFSTREGIDGGRIVLLYRRAPGTTRIEGVLRLRRVWLQQE